MSTSAKPAVDTATRVAAGDDGTNYDNVAITLHWATAVLVVTNFALAETWDWFAKRTQDSMQALHMSFGVVLALLILARLAWRLIPGHQLSSLESGWLKTASKAMHYLLYALLVAAIALGFAVQWSRGHPVSFFGLFDIPGPFGPFGRPVRRELKEIHNYVAWAIIIFAGLHAAAALYHHYVVKDRILERMLPAARRG